MKPWQAGCNSQSPRSAAYARAAPCSGRAANSRRNPGSGKPVAPGCARATHLLADRVHQLVHELASRCAQLQLSSLEARACDGAAVRARRGDSAGHMVHRRRSGSRAPVEPGGRALHLRRAAARPGVLVLRLAGLDVFSGERSHQLLPRQRARLPERRTEESQEALGALRVVRVLQAQVQVHVRLLLACRWVRIALEVSLPYRIWQAPRRHDAANRPRTGGRACARLARAAAKSSSFAAQILQTPIYFHMLR